MKVQANSIEEFFHQSAEKENDLRKVDQLIMKTVPDLQRGLKVIPSITMIGYWPKNTSREEWPKLGLAPQKNHISLYVSGEKDGQALGDYYANKLGKTNNGKACIRIKHLADVSIEGLQQLIRDVYHL